MEQKKPIGGPFVKGDPRINLRGRPKKGTALADIMRELGDAKDATLSDGTKVERKRALAERIWREAIKKGNPSMAALIWKMIDDPAQRLKIEGEDGEPIATMFVIQKRSIEEWMQNPTGEKKKKRSSSGNRNQGKPKRSPAQRLKSSLEEPKEEAKATSSSETSQQVSKIGEAHGEESSSVVRTKNSKKSSTARKKSMAKSKAPDLSEGTS